jgi:Fic family protein
MKKSDFTDQASGTLVPTIERKLAFVPNKLPPQIDLAKIAIPLSSAMQAIGELRGACRRLPNPYILVRPLQRQEALTSSAMEGTFTTADNLLLAEVGIAAQTDESTQEVINYLSALHEALGMLRELPISHRVIRRAHEILLSHLSSQRGAQKRPGEYKRDQNWIGGRTLEAARYVPPPPDVAAQCMDDLEAYINREPADFPTPLMDLALVHYQLEAIHPFSDGNGRVGRMLISLMAVHSGLLDTPVLYLSPVLERHKDEYIDLMFNVSAKGEWTEWLKFFFRDVEESCHETIATIDRLLELQLHLRAKVGQASRSANAITLVDHLFERPAITVTQAAEHLGVTYAAAKGTIDKLLELGIVSSFVDTYPKVFYSHLITAAARPIPAQEPPDPPQDDNGGEEQLTLPLGDHPT